MNARAKGHGQIRRSQVITTYGPGALIDLPKDSAIVGGLDKWPSESKLEEIDEPRLSRKLQMVLEGSSLPRLYAPRPFKCPWRSDRNRRLAFSRVVRRAGGFINY